MNKTFAVYMIIIAHENSIKMVDDAFFTRIVVNTISFNVFKVFNATDKTPKNTTIANFN